MKPRLLLVEDTFALRVAVAASLRNAGYDVVAVGSAEEAQDEAARVAPALVILDWMLPGQATATNLLRRLSVGKRDFLVDGEHVVSYRV